MNQRKQTIVFTLIRHGESAANVGNTVGGNAVPLTDEGKRQSALLGEYLTRTDRVFDAAWYSTLPRAEQTFAKIRQILPKDRIVGQRIFADARLIERQHGKWEGQPAKDTWTRQEIARMNQIGADYSTPGGESFRMVERRMSLWLDDALKAARLLKQDQVHFLVVSHGHALRCLIGSQLQICSSIYWRMALDNTSITLLRWDDEKGWFLDGMNARPHLEG